MAIKLLLLTAMLINHNDGNGGTHTPAGFAEVANKDTAAALVATGNALYTNRKDDPRKDASDTATPDDIRAVETQIKAAEAAAQAREKETAKA